jgi:hypothetical protein
MRTAFPSSLVGRYSYDYCGASVTLGLAPLRRSHVRPRCTYLARLRRPTHLLECPHGASLRTLKVASTHRPCRRKMRHRLQASFRWMEFCIFWRLGYQVIQLSPYRTGPATPRFIRLNTIAAFLTCYRSLQFSRPGKSSGPGTFLQVPPYSIGDTTGRLVAHTV